MSALLDALPALHWLRPWWLLALLVLPLLGWRLHRRVQRRGHWATVVDAHLLPHLLVDADSGGRRAWAGWLGLTGLLLAILALAGPSLGQQQLPLWQNRQPLVIALDLSRATLARDLPPNRLLQARAKLASLLRQRDGGPVALLAFADDAFTVAPLTMDPANVAIFLDALSPDVMPADGQRVDRAIARARQLLRQAGFARGRILLLTDHADAAAIAAAAAAHAGGDKVSALGLGSAQGGVYAGENGLRQARLDADSLRALAASGGGDYQPLAADDADLRALGLLQPSADAAASAGHGTLARWRDDGYWLLPLVMLCLLPLFRRGGALALLACVFWLPLPLPPAQAQAQQVAPPPQGTLWQRADQAAHAQLQDGIAAYRRKDYPQAIARFTSLADAEGQYNLGNALAQAGRLDEAIAAYDRALKRQPGMADARYNKALVEAARKRQQASSQNKNRNDQGQQRQGKQGQDRQGQQQKAQQQGAQKPQDGPPSKSKQQQQSAQQDKPQPAQSAAAEQPRDAQQQAQANAAQRQRMQQALRKQQGKSEAAKKTDRPPETPAQRERRLANQAWLQRVPDDPGALLRARFQLEARRRQQGGGP